MTPLAVERRKVWLFKVPVEHPEVEYPEMRAEWTETAAWAENAHRPGRHRLREAIDPMFPPHRGRLDLCPRCEEEEHWVTVRVNGDEACTCCAFGPLGLVVKHRSEMPFEQEPTIEFLQRDGRWK